jgi:hypothetical protein
LSGGGYRGGSTLIHPGSGWFSKSNPKKKDVRQQSLKELCDPAELSEAKIQAANRRMKIQLKPKNKNEKLKSSAEILEAARKQLLHIIIDQILIGSTQIKLPSRLHPNLQTELQEVGTPAEWASAQGEFETLQTKKKKKKEKRRSSTRSIGNKLTL